MRVRLWSMVKLSTSNFCSGVIAVSLPPSRLYTRWKSPSLFVRTSTWPGFAPNATSYSSTSPWPSSGVSFLPTTSYW